MNTTNMMVQMVRANPSLAMLALTLDTLIGTIVGVVVYVLLNSQDVSFGALGVMVVTALLAIGGMVAFGYNHFRARLWADEDEG